MRDKTKTGLEMRQILILAFGSQGLTGLREKNHFWLLSLLCLGFSLFKQESEEKEARF